MNFEKKGDFATCPVLLPALAEVVQSVTDLGFSRNKKLKPAKRLESEKNEDVFFPGSWKSTVSKKRNRAG